MKKTLTKRVLSLLLSLALPLSLAACGEDSAADGGGYDNATLIELSDGAIAVNGKAAPTDESAAVYTAHDIVYYESGRGFTYGEGTEDDAHDASEADAHTVVHITQPGSYLLTGRLSAGQIAVDLGKNAKTDPNAVVELVLDNADITCTVAPAIIFYNVYECDEAFVDYDENDTEGYEPTCDVDTTAAGAVVTLLAGTENTVSGSYVARIYKPDSVELSEDGTAVESAKKLHKYDGALYSKMSMNVSGEGKLTINAANEGLDSELHLTIHSGDITINAGNDGINTNEDGVSVTAINGGTLTVNVTGATGEGDGIDSNGWIVINGGTVRSFACSKSMDSGLDADMGIYLNGGTVLATGNMLDRIDGEAQTYAVFQFAQRQAGGEVYTLRTADGEAAATLETENDFQYLVFSSADLAPGDYTLWCGETQLTAAKSAQMGMMGGAMPDQPPEGFDPGMEPPEMPDGAEPPEGFDPGMEPPEMPGGAEPPEGFGGMGGRPDGRGGEAAATETVFSLAAGANYFTAIAGAS